MVSMDLLRQKVWRPTRTRKHSYLKSDLLLLKVEQNVCRSVVAPYPSARLLNHSFDSFYLLEIFVEGIDLRYSVLSHDRDRQRIVQSDQAFFRQID